MLENKHKATTIPLLNFVRIIFEPITGRKKILMNVATRKKSVNSDFDMMNNDA